MEFYFERKINFQPTDDQHNYYVVSFMLSVKYFC